MRREARVQCTVRSMPTHPPSPASAHAPSRVVAVDWSGALVGSERKLWLCEVDARGVVRLEDGRSRDVLIAHLCDEAARDPRLVAGFDFAFSFPAWFVATFGDAFAVWRAAQGLEGEWLAAAAPPFWGRGGGARRDATVEHFRRTEGVVGGRVGIRPKSVFQVAGAGSVGTGSIRGMPHLLTLREAGFAVWPFEPARADAPLAIEIWPRLCYGEPVVKARATSRADWLARHAPDLAPAHRAAAEASDDAFDALAAGLAMWAAHATFVTLPPARDAQETLEGRIWEPPPTE
jgi:hypothetical protein